MRLRKYISILLISFANIFLLVHSVVPHIHHDGIVCFNSENGSDCSSCNVYGDNEICCDHNHAHENHQEDCDLKQTVLRDGDPTDDTLVSQSQNLLFSISILNSNDLLILKELEVQTDDRYRPYLESHYTPYIGSSFGLRAPPRSILS